jgi:glycosyltransferase involved in cell wall biosynthesis
MEKTMKILLIATGFAPYSFSENIVNSKLVLAFLNAGWHVDVVSRKDEGVSYSSDWDNEWKELQLLTHEVIYPTGTKWERLLDTISCSFTMGIPLEGVRWAKRAYDKALELHAKNNYDVVISRSPSDISHLPAYHFSKRTGVKWIANWNDPIAHIWPEPYTQKMSFLKKTLFSIFTDKVIVNADINSFPSEDLRDYFMRFSKKLNHENSVTIPHIGFSSLVKVQKKELPIFRMCHAGNLSTERNPEQFFQAIVQFLTQNKEAAISVDLLGVANSQLESLVKKYSLENYVHFIGSLPYMNALLKMAEYDVLIIIEANSKDGIYLPSKVTDYSQLGIPIFAITPEKSCIHKLMTKYGGGVSSDCSSKNTISNGMQELYDVWQEDYMMKKYNTTQLYSCFKAENIIEKYTSIFKEMSL